MRAKVGLLDNLHPADFMRLVRLIGQFVNSSAGITGRSCPHLRLALFSQAKKFLETFHGNKKDKLRRLLDGERWRQADVPLEVQNITAKMEEGMKSSDDKTDSSDKPGLMRYMSQHNEQFLTVHGQRFAVVGVLCILITMINEYCQSAEDLPMLITDILVKLVDLLKFFNAYTCQLVLGAGAVEVVGLKTITTRHLAIVLRCLQAIMLIIQDVKAHFRKKLTLQKCILLLQFDQVNEVNQSVHHSMHNNVDMIVVILSLPPIFIKP
jgi:vacuolar protein sorting-associated protein 54